MSRLEKNAWYKIVVIVVACLLYGLIYLHVGFFRATCSLGLLGLLGFAPLFLKGKLDEREQLIRRRAGAVMAGFFWIFFVGSFMMAWLLRRSDILTLPAMILPSFIWVAYILVTLIHSIAILIFSRVELRHAE